LAPLPSGSARFPYTTLFRSDCSAGAVGERRGVARGHGALRVEGGAQLGQPLGGGVRTEDGVEVDRHLAGVPLLVVDLGGDRDDLDRKSTRLNSSHVKISYAV